MHREIGLSCSIPDVGSRPLFLALRIPAEAAQWRWRMSANSTQADSQETIQVGAMGIRFLVEPADSNGSVSVFECFVPADSRMPAPHSHDAFEETIYGLEGVTTWTVDGRTVDIGPGDATCILRGAIHGFDNRGNK